MMDYSIGFLKEKEINQGLSSSYLNSYRTLFKHMRKSRYLDLEDLSTFNLDNTLKFFQNHSKKWTPSGYNQYRKNYNVFISYLVREYKIYDFRKSFVPKHQPKKLPKLFESYEINKLLTNSNTRERNILTFFLYSGIRKDEFLNLRKTDIRRGEIRIRNGKGNKERIIPIHDDLQRIVNKLDFNYTKYFLDILSKKYKKVVKNFHWHRCRHTFATALVRNQADIYTISELLGHSSIKTTTIYLSLDLEKKREALNKLHF